MSKYLRVVSLVRSIFLRRIVCSHVVVSVFCRRFVVLVSDANIEQYGITPAELGKLLRHQPNVRVFLIFIGECYPFCHHARPSTHTSDLLLISHF